MQAAHTKHGIIRSKHVYPAKDCGISGFKWTIRFFGGKELECYKPFFDKERATQDLLNTVEKLKETK